MEKRHICPSSRFALPLNNDRPQGREQVRVGADTIEIIDSLRSLAYSAPDARDFEGLETQDARSVIPKSLDCTTCCERMFGEPEHSVRTIAPAV